MTDKELKSKYDPKVRYYLFENKDLFEEMYPSIVAIQVQYNPGSLGSRAHVQIKLSQTTLRPNGDDIAGFCTCDVFDKGTVLKEKLAEIAAIFDASEVMDSERGEYISWFNVSSAHEIAEGIMNEPRD